MTFQEELLTFYLRQRTLERANQVWDMCLSEEERARVENIEEVYRQGGAAAIYAMGKSISIERAIIEVAHLCGMPELQYRNMLRKLPVEDLPPVVEIGFKIAWNKETGELTLNGRIVRRVATIRAAKNIVSILDAFESAGWPISVKFPKAILGDVDRQGQAVRSLNRELSAIHFERDGTGEGVRWRAIR